ncbi:hypothetical protein BDN67DRAFT_152976 [Paxillus ammoniavirescens]|nr:hypothetical protein BDN67DRAFT_152976 [Paxillus ammoniavirescens]
MDRIAHDDHDGVALGHGLRSSSDSDGSKRKGHSGAIILLTSSTFNKRQVKQIVPVLPNVDLPMRAISRYAWDIVVYACSLAGCSLPWCLLFCMWYEFELRVVIMKRE